MNLNLKHEESSEGHSNFPHNISGNLPAGGSVAVACDRIVSSDLPMIAAVTKNKNLVT
jgi:hypothetical protein